MTQKSCPEMPEPRWYEEDLAVPREVPRISCGQYIQDGVRWNNVASGLGQ